MSPRVAVAIALAQFFAVILCFFILGLVMKFNGYPGDYAPLLRWMPWAVFLREHGLWFLAIPALWGAFAHAASRIDRGLVSEAVALALGIALALAICFAFIWAMIHPFYRPLLYDLTPLAPGRYQ